MSEIKNYGKSIRARLLNVAKLKKCMKYNEGVIRRLVECDLYVKVTLCSILILCLSGRVIFLGEYLSISHSELRCNRR